MNNSMDNFNNQSTQHQAQAPANPMQANTRNGIAQPMDPMGDSVNPFDVIDYKAGNHFSQQQAPQVGPNGMPIGSAPMAMPQSPQQQGGMQSSDEGAAPMDKWFAIPDNGSQGGQQQADPNNPLATPAAPAQPATPEAYQSLFAKSKMEEFQALTNKRDFVGDLFNDDMAAAFKEGDFTSLPNLINAAVQQGAAMSGFISSRVSDKAVNGMFENFQNATLPGLLRTNQLDTMWQNPEFSNFSSPAMQPMVAMATNHVKGMYPDASPQEIQTKAMAMMQDYSKQMASMSFAPQQSQQQEQTPAGNGLSDMEMLFNQPT